MGRAKWCHVNIFSATKYSIAPLLLLHYWDQRIITQIYDSPRKHKEHRSLQNTTGSATDVIIISPRTNRINQEQG